MQGVRWSEDDLAAHQARMARHRPSPAGTQNTFPSTPVMDTAAPSGAGAENCAPHQIHGGPVPGSPGDEGMGDGQGVIALPSRSAPHAERRTQKRTSRSPSARSTAKAERGTGPGGGGAEIIPLRRRDGAKPRAKQKRPEQVLQISAIEFLRVALPPSWRVFHVPNGGARSPIEAAILKAMGVWPGVGDLAFIGPGGRFVGAEAKAGRNGLTEDQSEWRDWCLGNGVPWFLFRTIDELVAGCADAGIPLRVRHT